MASGRRCFYVGVLGFLALIAAWPRLMSEYGFVTPGRLGEGAQRFDAVSAVEQDLSSELIKARAEATRLRAVLSAGGVQVPSRHINDECAPYVVMPPAGHVDLTKLLGKIRGEAGNDWSACTHLKTYGLNFAVFVARFLTYQLQPKTALEFGGGLGTTSDYLARFAEADVTCIEPDRMLAQLVSSVHTSTRGVGRGMMTELAVNVLSEESQKCTATLEAKKFDLVCSFEVLEHIPLKYHDAIVKFLVASTGKWLVFSAARPKQVGTGHFDESMFDHGHWVNAFEEAGLLYMPKLTFLAIKSGWYPRAYDFGTNLMVLKHPSNPYEDTDEPHDMLKYYWEGNMHVVPLPPPFKLNYYTHERHKDFKMPYATNDPRHQVDIWQLSKEFQAGVESSLWPELSQLSKQIQHGAVPCD